jgi:hypothetical protein
LEEADVTAEDNVEAEIGVVELGGSDGSAFEKELSIESPSRGLAGRSSAGAAEAGAS